MSDTKEVKRITNLSDRIRPNSEAAPWVVEEVKLMEAERDEALRIMKGFRDEALDYARINRLGDVSNNHFIKQATELLAALHPQADKE